MWLLHNTQKKQALPSVITLTLGKATIFLFSRKSFAECNYLDTRQNLQLCRVPDAWHSAKIQTSPSADLAALGEEPLGWHSAKFGSLPSATRPALGKVSDFAECQGNCTRQNIFLENRKMVALPSVRVITLGKACFFLIM